MAIVPDLSGTRPGRSGNIPLSDPRNLSHRERTVQDDGYKTSAQVTMLGTAQPVLLADKTRNCILFTNREVTGDAIQVSTEVTGRGLNVLPSNVLEIKGAAAQLAYYALGTASAVLFVMEG